MILYLVPLLAIFPLIGLPLTFFYASDTQRYKLSFVFLLAFFFSIMGFYFVPKIGTDLTRYFSNYIDIMRGSSFSSIFTLLSPIDKLMITQQLIFFVASRFGNDQILPLITMFIVYFNGFYIVTSFSRENKLNVKITLAMLLLFAVCPTFSLLANNTRNIVATSFICVAMYRDLYLHNHSFTTLVFYFFGMTTHIAVIPLVVIRIVTSFLVNIKRMALVKSISIIIIVSLMALILFKTGLYAALLSKARFYLSGGTSGSAVQQWFVQADSSIVERVSKIMAALATFIFDFIILTFYKENKSDVHVVALVCLFIINGLTFTLTFFPGTTWFRFYFVAYFFIPIFFYYTTKIVSRNIKSLLVLFWIMFVLWSIVLQIFRLNQQTYLSTFLKNVFLSPILGISN